MQRLEAFLAEPEVPAWSSAVKAYTGSQYTDGKVGFEKAKFEWDISPKDEQARFTLGPLDIQFPKSRLTVISGPTGAGKSAILNALLGGLWMFSCYIRFTQVYISQRCTARQERSFWTRAATKWRIVRKTLVRKDMPLFTG